MNNPRLGHHVHRICWFIGVFFLFGPMVLAQSSSSNGAQSKGSNSNKSQSSGTKTTPAKPSDAIYDVMTNTFQSSDVCSLFQDIQDTEAQTIKQQLKTIKANSSVITSKAANDYHFKTGQRDWPFGTENVLPCRLLWRQVGFGAPAPRTAFEHVSVVQ